MSEDKTKKVEEKKRPRGRPKKVNERIAEISNIIDEADMEKNVKKRDTKTEKVTKDVKTNKKEVQKDKKVIDNKTPKKTSTRKSKISQEEKAIKKIEEIKEKSNIKDESKKKIYGKIIIETLMAISIILVLIFLSYWYNIISEDNLKIILRTVSISSLVISIVIFEVAYKKDNEFLGIRGVEILIFGMITLVLIYMPMLNYFLYKMILMYAVLLYFIYYGIKSIVIYVKDKKKYERKNSDIGDIIKK